MVVDLSQIDKVLCQWNFQIPNYRPKMLCKLPSCDSKVLAIQFYYDEFSSFNTVKESVGSAQFVIKNFPQRLWKKFKYINFIGKFFFFKKFFFFFFFEPGIFFFLRSI